MAARPAPPRGGVTTYRPRAGWRRWWWWRPREPRQAARARAVVVRSAGARAVDVLQDGGAQGRDRDGGRRGGLDRRHRLTARTADKKSAFMCAKAKAKSEFYKRREVRASRIYLFIYCLTSSACACVYTGAAGLLVRRAGPRGLAQMQADGVWQAHVADG